MCTTCSGCRPTQDWSSSAWPARMQERCRGGWEDPEMPLYQFSPVLTRFHLTEEVDCISCSLGNQLKCMLSTFLQGGESCEIKSSGHILCPLLKHEALSHLPHQSPCPKAAAELPWVGRQLLSGLFFCDQVQVQPSNQLGKFLELRMSWYDVTETKMLGGPSPGALERNLRWGVRCSPLRRKVTYFSLES